MDTPYSSPSDYSKQSDLVGSGSQPGYYDLTDGVSDERFEDALAEAKDECEAGQMMDPEARAAWLEDARSRMKSPTAQQLAIVRAAFARAGRVSPEEVAGSPETPNNPRGSPEPSPAVSSAAPSRRSPNKPISPQQHPKSSPGRIEMAPRPDDDALSVATLAAMNAFYRAGGQHAVETSDMPKVIDAFRAAVEVVLRGSKPTPTAPALVKKLFSADDAAEVLGIGASTVRLMMTSGRLKYVRVGRGRKISAQEIERFIGEGEKFADDER